jgi:hypothetical protein
VAGTDDSQLSVRQVQTRETHRHEAVAA